MLSTDSIQARKQHGVKARARAKRSSHGIAGNTDRDPVKLLRISSADRVTALIPLRYGRMAASPFTFFRGSAILQAHDLAGTPDTGIDIPVCGDAHLLNFGGFATPERQLVFDLNDFDEVATGPWEWDLKRLTASFAIAGQHLGFSRGDVADAVMAAATEYRRRMAEYAQNSALDIWYEGITFDRMLEDAQTPQGRRLISKSMEKAAGRTHDSVLRKMAFKQDGQWQIRDAPPALFHPNGPNSLLDGPNAWPDTATWKKKMAKCYGHYLDSLAPDRRELLKHFTTQDVVFKVVGVGSVGTRCLVMLLTDSWDNPLFLQVKEARRSVVARYSRAKSEPHEGYRVVTGQRLLQAASDIFLGWASGPRGRDYYFRQLRDMKVSADVESFDARLLAGYARICGWALARAHAKASGRAIELAAYMGRGDAFPDALVEYAREYARQNEKDYRAFTDACRSGKLPLRTDEDMAADFRV
ncbi:DUF2252 domain-containing protein [Achromobacter sp. UMC46]|uniref:DUF2252 domain-containing protein n=1 Tax=Achromobacter sp. UMC46 TaxID=1862319 RepID=UPI0016019E01|nr:DUF2252 domain-containing protein [Achromobacter sp. UMC46]MBB1594564.1 hypothetical protein [Achromobacter sp. UMC46]